MKKYINNYILESINVKKEILASEEIVEAIANSVKLIINTYKSEGKILLAGNGGSAADAQHIATELVSKFMQDRPPLNALALTTNTSILTAIGNDYNNDFIFSRQIQAYGNKNDVYIAISTSGNSKNIIKSIIEAKNKNISVIGFTGAQKSQMDNLCDILIKIPSINTPIIQEAHIMIGHTICALVEKELF